VPAEKPIIHGRDHRHGGADVLLIPWEDVEKNVKDAKGASSKFLWGDYLTATDEGGGVVRIDGVFASKLGYKETAQSLALVGYWSFQQTGTGGDDVLNNEAEGASGFLGWIEGDSDAEYAGEGPGGELALAGVLHPGAHKVVNTTSPNRIEGSWGATPPPTGSDSISDVMNDDIHNLHPFAWCGWVYMEDKQWTSAAPLWFSGRGALEIVPMDTPSADIDMTGFPLDARATSSEWVLRFFRWHTDLSGGTFIDSSPVPSNQWVFLAISYDGEEMQIYANGEEVGSGAGSSGNVGMGAAASYDFNLGYGVVVVSGFPSWSMYLAGRFAGVCFFDDALQADQVMALYQTIISAAGEEGQVLTSDGDGNVKYTWPQKVTVDGA